VIPRTLAEWNLDSIRTLLASGAHESDTFEFKERLPDSRDDSGKERLRRTCCGFANSVGGFLVFGVSDDRSRPVEERLVGIDRSEEFPLRFGDFPRSCLPSIDWSARNPPIELPTGRHLHVFQVPRSWRAPHAVGPADQGLRFMKRTDKGSESMSVEEVRAAFLGFYEKRIRLQLLDAELMELFELAGQVPNADPTQDGSHYSLITFDDQSIKAIVAETFPLTAGHAELHAHLRKLRERITVANNKSRIFFATAGLAMTNQRAFTADHNQFMREVSGRIRQLAEQSRVALRPLLVP
jgi:hypothetical protein